MHNSADNGPANATAALISQPRRLLLPLIVLAIGLGGYLAWRQAWLCDDAFISYRYAKNLVEGRGLVFNAGERVEGYTNFLWTIWCAAGLRLGVTAEQWSIWWGIGFYVASIGVLGWQRVELNRAVPALASTVPVAAIFAACHPDWNIFATSGLESSAFTFFLLLGIYLLMRPMMGARARPVVAGLVMGLAALTRPEGTLMALVGAGICWFAESSSRPMAVREKIRTLLAYGLAFAVLWVPFLMWRRWYYGDFLPNTYYAKSANLAWWEQGYEYLRLYFERYWVLLVSVLFAPVVMLRSTPGTMCRLFVAVGLVAIVYTLAVTRMGGDFMYARMLIPATPFYLWMFELAWSVALPKMIPARTASAHKAGSNGRADVLGVLRALLTAVPIGAMLVTASPLEGTGRDHGIANEHDFYLTTLVDGSRDEKALELRRLFKGLDVSMAFFGAHAHLMYRSDVPVAIESEAGLTDRVIARQPLAQRGRVGHEKQATARYLVEERHANFAFGIGAALIHGLNEEIPDFQCDFVGLGGIILYWDPPLMAELRRRGLKVPDLDRAIDAQIRELPKRSGDEVREIYQKYRRFYFDHVSDRREELFEARLKGLPAPALGVKS